MIDCVLGGRGAHRGLVEASAGLGLQSGHQADQVMGEGAGGGPAGGHLEGLGYGSTSGATRGEMVGAACRVV